VANASLCPLIREKNRPVMPKIAVIGEGVIDRFVSDSGSRDVIGGSGLNTAVAMRRAGSDAVWFSRLAQDANGLVLSQYAKSEGVLSTPQIIGTEPASLVEVFLTEAGQPRYRFSLDGAVDWQWTDAELNGLDNSYEVIQIGSLSAVLEPGSEKLLRKLQKLKMTTHPPLITYDPNARPSAAKNDSDANRMKSRILEMVSISDVVKVSDEDLSWIDSNSKPFDTAKLWSEIGPSLVVMTKGAEGAVAFSKGLEIASVSGIEIQVVDTVGAGDTFMAWLVHQIANKFECKVPSGQAAITSLIETCVEASAITCSREGCKPPFADEVI